MKDGDLALFLYRRKCQKRKRSVIEGCWGEGGEREEGGVRQMVGEPRRDEGKDGGGGCLSKLPLAGAFIKCSGQRRADNSALSIRFNPLKDLNVHLL